jgi:sialic acid synthase SpsE
VDINEAKEAIKAANEAGASLSKLQLFNAEDDKGQPWYEWVKSHALTFDQARELFDYGASIGQEVFFSVFHPKYVDWCEKIGVKRYKIAFNNGKSEPLFESKINCMYTGKPVLHSIGLSNSLDFNSTSNKYLYCIPKYPAIPTQFYLNSVNFKDKFVGLSDHSVGLDIAKIALARGAKIIEKHFVLKHNDLFPDNDWSMDVNELKELVRFDKVCQEVLG